MNGPHLHGNRCGAEGLTSDPLVATILLTTGAPWVEKESKEMAIKVVFISLVVGTKPKQYQCSSKVLG